MALVPPPRHFLRRNCVSWAKRESKDVHRFYVDPRCGQAVYDPERRMFAFEQSDGRWVTVSMAPSVVGVESAHEFPVFLDAVRRLYGDRMAEAPVEHPKETSPSNAAVAAFVIFLLAIVAVVVLIVLRSWR